MQIHELVEEAIKNITYSQYLEYEKQASLAKKFRFNKRGMERECGCCGKRTERYWWAGNSCDMICSSCARKVARGVILAISMKKIRNSEYSRGVGYGYQLATRKHYAEDTHLFISMLIEDAKKHDRTVHFLGRDMDILFMCFNTEDNVNYLAGWNRAFIFEDINSKANLLVKNNVKRGDFILDTGFAGSILNDMQTVMDVEGYLLSSGQNCKYTSLYNYSHTGYRDWVCDLEHIDRSRVVQFNNEIGLPEEVRTKPDWHEKGIFDGFVHGMREVAAKH